MVDITGYSADWKNIINKQCNSKPLNEDKIEDIQEKKIFTAAQNLSDMSHL